MTREQFIKILCRLEGLKTAVKNVHWYQVFSSNKHNVLDEIHKLLEYFSDKFAEDGITIFGGINMHEIKNTSMKYNDDTDLVYKIERFAKKCKEIVNEDNVVEFAGLNSICDEFVHNMKINVYRYQMS